jgi:hypothetical protein
MNSSNVELTFAIIENDIVINVILATDLDTVKLIYPDKEIIQVDTNKIGMHFFRENNKWYPPKPHTEDDPQPQVTWVEEINAWLTDEMMQIYLLENE